MKNVKKWIYIMGVTTLACITAGQLTHAEDKSSGCGLGWAVTKKTTLSATTTRGTTHASLPPTYGMTSGTSGCAQHSFVKSEQEAVVFAAANFETLKIEMAQGKGEFLSAFANTLHCKNQEAFSKNTQQNFAELSNSETGVDLYKKVRTLINTQAKSGGPAC